MAHRRKSRFVAIWGAPLLLAAVTAVGLVSALFSDGGAGDILAGVMLSIPVAVGVWYGYVRRGRCTSSLGESG